MNVLGIDVSSFAVDLVLLDENGNSARWIHCPLAGDLAFDRLREVPAAMPAASWYEENGVYLAAIEVPKGRFMNSVAALFPVYGAAVAALPRDLLLWDVHPKSWRLELGLKGNATKQHCAQKVRSLMAVTKNGPAVRLDFAHECMDWPQDALDAFAVAYYAREINRRAIEQRAA